jgi:hypothetical protein
VDFADVYLPGIYSTRIPEAKGGRTPLVLFIILPLLIFISTSILSNYTLLANSALVEEMLDNVAATTSEENREVAESARRSMETAMQLPGARLYVSSVSSLVSTWTLLLFLAAFAVPSALLVNRHGFMKDFLFHGCMLTIIPTAGFLANLAAKILCLDPRVTIGPALFITVADRSSFPGLFLNQVDVFTVWYLTALSLRLSRVSKEDLLTFLATAIGCWLILDLGSFLAGIPFGLMS